MGSREQILDSIRAALGDRGESREESVLPMPEVPEIWPMEDLDIDEMAREFEVSLESVAGQVVRCENLQDAAAKAAGCLASLVDGPITVGVMTNELVESLLGEAMKAGREFCLRLTPIHAPGDPAGADPVELDRMNASIVRAEFLLADTGSVVVRLPSAFDRLLCYLSPACFVVAKKSELREHMPHAWPEIQARLDPGTSPSGEFAIITGPSRTADIEKVLVLGVHGPKQLTVFLLDDDTENNDTENNDAVNNDDTENS